MCAINITIYVLVIFLISTKAITTATTTNSHEFIVLSSATKRRDSTPDMSACLPLLYGPRSGSMV